MSIISIIIPVYNTEKYVGRCIKSILEQSFSNFELILVNDGSTDFSGQVCEDMLKLDDRIKYISKENDGPTSAIKKGLKYAVGQYACFVDSDDYLYYDILDILYKKIIEGDFDAVKSGLNTDVNGILKSGAIMQQDRAFGEEEIESILTDFFEKTGSCSDTWSNSRCGKLFKTSLAKAALNCCDDKLKMGEDLEFNLRYLGLCHKVLIVYEYSGYCVVIREESATSTFSSDLKFTQLKFIKAMKNVAKEQNRNGTAIPYLKNLVLAFTMMAVMNSNLTVLQMSNEIKWLCKESSEKKTMRNQFYNGGLSMKIASNLFSIGIYRATLYGWYCGKKVKKFLGKLNIKL